MSLRPALDPAAIMRVKNLHWRAKVIVQGFLTGLHRSPYHGFSVEFTEYRPYTSGDDLRYLDWRLLARSDRYYVKRFEDETNLRCHLLLDASRSMGFGSGEVSKYEYARTLVATLAYFLAQQRDAAGLVTFDEAIREYIPARFRPGHLHRLLLGLERSVAGTATDLSAPLEQIARTVRKRGLIVLVSDFLAPLESLADQLALVRALGHEVVVFRVLDPTERSFEFREAALFQDAETGREIYIDPEAVRRDYTARFEQHDQGLRRICGDHGIELCQLETNQALDGALFDFLQARQRFQRFLTRRRGATAGGGR